MSPRVKKLIATLLIIVVWLPVYALVVMGIATHVLPQAAWQAGRLVPGIRPDAGVTATVAEAFAAAGRGFERSPPPLPFATDFGSISQRAPAALVGVGRPAGWAFHSDEGAAQFASSAGLDAAAEIATVLALAAVRLAEPAT